MRGGEGGKGRGGGDEGRRQICPLRRSDTHYRHNAKKTWINTTEDNG